MSTGWEIGARAREALLNVVENWAADLSADGLMREVEELLLDRCTDADDVAKCRQLLTDDDGLQQGEQEPVAWRNAITGEIRHSITGLMKHSGNWEPYRKRLPLADNIDAALDCLYTKAMHLRAHGGHDANAIGAAYDVVRSALGRPPVGLPPGWVPVPEEWPNEMLHAAITAPLPAVLIDSRRGSERMELRARIRAALAAGPPCPGAVELPEGWPWTPEIREYLRFLLLEARERAIRHVNADTADAAFDLARWLESQGAEQEKQGRKDA